MILLDKHLDEILKELIDLYYDEDSKEKKKLLNNDIDSIREIGKIGETGFTSDEILEVINIRSLDINSLKYMRKIAKKRKIASLIYRIIIGNLKLDDEELIDSLDLLNLKINEGKKYKLVKKNK